MSSNDDSQKGSERREHKRIPMSARVTVHSNLEASFYFVRDVSEGGAFILSENPPPIGESLDCQLSREGFDLVEVAGEVVHHETDGGKVIGCGVKFVEITPDTSAILKKIIESD